MRSRWRKIGSVEVADKLVVEEGSHWAKTTSDDGKTMEVCFSTDDFVEMHVSSVVLGEVVVRTDDRVSEVVFFGSR